ncbi:hypothetical protein D044_1744B, partial [Vibrio parahaemolyticus EKP-026]
NNASARCILHLFKQIVAETCGSFLNHQTVHSVWTCAHFAT